MLREERFLLRSGAGIAVISNNSLKDISSELLKKK